MSALGCPVVDLLGAPLPLAYLFNGWALFGLGAALTAVPILIHLLNRRRVRVVPWAAMTFLLAALKRNKRRLQLENWLVLALRVAAVLLLGLALARPVLTDSSLAGLAGGRRSVYLVLDTSGSTQARREARSVSDALKAEATFALEGLEAEDAFCVLVTNDPRQDASTGRQPAVLVPRTSGSSALARAKESVAGLAPREAPAAWPATLELLARQMVVEDAGRHVLVVTDLTAHDFTQGAALERWAEALRALVRRGARVTFVDVGARGDGRANLAVVAVTERGDREPFQGRPVFLSVRVANHGPAPVGGALVTLRIEGDSGEVWRKTRAAPMLAAADPATASPGVGVVDFDAPAAVFRLPGAFAVRAEVSPPASHPAADALALDSVRHAALDVRERVRVLAWAQPSQGAPQHPLALLRPSFNPVPPERPAGGEVPPPVFELTEAESEGGFAMRLKSSGSRPDLVILANAAPRRSDVQAELTRHVRDGGGLLVFVGDALDPRMWNDPFHRVSAADRLLPLALESAQVPPRRPDAPAPFHLDLATASPEAWAGAFSGPDVALWLGRYPPQLLGRMPFAAPPSGTTPGPGTPEAPASPEPPRQPVASPPADARVVLRWSEGGGAALVEGRLGLGRTLWLGTSLDEGWLKQGVPFFLPVFLEEAAFHLTRSSEAVRSLLVGETLEAILPRGAEGERLVAPGGRELALTRQSVESDSERRRVTSDMTGTAGAWRLSFKPAPGASGPASAWYAVNVDTDEGALQRADPLRLSAAAGAEAPVEVVDSLRALAASTQAAREGELARLLLGIVLGLLALESLLAFWLGRRAAPGEAAPAPGAL